MSKKNPKKSNYSNERIPESPNKKTEYQVFITWLALPGLLRGKSKKELEKLGIDNPLVQELLDIQYQKDFSERFGVDESQLSRWKQKAKEDGSIMLLTRKWAQDLTPNVVLGFYRRVVDKGTAAEVRLWLEFVERWEGAREERIDEIFNSSIQKAFAEMEHSD